MASATNHTQFATESTLRDASPGGESARGSSLYESLVVLDKPKQRPEMDDGAVPGGYQVDNLADSDGVFVSGDRDGARLDLAGSRASSRKVQR